MGSFVYQDCDQILENIKQEAEEKHNIELKVVILNDRKAYKYSDFSLSFLSCGYYSVHLDKLLDINFTDKELFFICPIVIRYGLFHSKKDFKRYEILIKLLLKNLKFYEQQKKRHIFFFPGDNNHIYDCIASSLIFTVSPSVQTNALPLYYTSPTVCDSIVNIEECPVDISFHGCLTTHKIRPKSVNALYHIKKYTKHIHCNFSFIEYLGEKNYLRHIYKKSLQECKFVLCPRGHGSNSIRFFESLNFGKIPILISDDGKLPLRSKINYSEFCIEIPEKHCSRIEQYVDNFLKKHNLKQASLKAREISDAWFSMNSLDKFVVESVRERNKLVDEKNDLFV